MAQTRLSSLPLITVFGLGHLRPAPGTWGSLPPCALVGALWLAGLTPASRASTDLGSGVGTFTYFLMLGCVLLLACWACVRYGDEAERRYGKDPSQCVMDETAGQCVALLALPWSAFGSLGSMVAWGGAAFVLFRIFDIIKPPPAHQIQRARAGWGILLDDLVAGLYAAIVLAAAGWWVG